MTHLMLQRTEAGEAITLKHDQEWYSNPMSHDLGPAFRLVFEGSADLALAELAAEADSNGLDPYAADVHAVIALDQATSPSWMRAVAAVFRRSDGVVQAKVITRAMRARGIGCIDATNKSSMALRGPHSIRPLGFAWDADAIPTYDRDALRRRIRRLHRWLAHGPLGPFLSRSKQAILRGAGVGGRK